jgi:U5 small nuclear ribonucleoprotein component
MSKKEELFDEFGNYFGNVEDSDDSDNSFEEDDEEDNEEEMEKESSKLINKNLDQEEAKQEVVLFEDKNYYPTLQEAFPEAEVMVEEEDAMDIEQPILPPPKTQKYHITGAADGKSKLDKEYQEKGFLEGILATPKDNRNLAVIGPYHSGKTLLIDLLIQEQSIYTKDSSGDIDTKKGFLLKNKMNLRTSQTENTSMFPSSQMYKRFMDNILLERQRKCTIFSKPISLLLETSKHKNKLINLIDTPGHPDFYDETLAALEMVDGVIFVIDIIEGLTIEGKKMLRDVMKRQLDIIFVINKMDRLIIEMRLPPNDAYLKVKLLLDDINNFMKITNPNIFCQRELNPGFFKDSENLMNSKRKKYRAQPTRSNVMFCSTKYHFLFNLKTFREIYFQKTHEHLPKNTSIKFLWGDVFFDKENKKFLTKKLSSNTQSLKRTFVEFVLEPLYKIFAHCLAKEDTELREFCLKLGLILPKDNLFNLTLKNLLKKILSCTLLKSRHFVDCIMELVVNPLEGNKRILSNILVNQNILESHQDTLVIYFPKVFPDIPDDGDIPQNFSVFGRVLNGKLDLKDNSRALVLVNEGYKTESMIYTDDQFDSYQFDFESKEEHFQVKVENIYLSNTNFKISVSQANPGNLIQIPNLGNIINKCGYLFSIDTNKEITQNDLNARNILLKMPSFGKDSFVKVGLEPLKPSELPQMLEGLKSLKKVMNGVRVRIEESGEHLILATGELMMDSALHFLREVFTKIEVRLTEPTACFSETVLQTSKTFAICKTPNQENQITLLSEPLEKDIFLNINYLNNTRPSLRSEFVSEFCPQWDALDVKGLWTFGPNEDFPNALIEDVLCTEDQKRQMFGENQPTKNFLMNGFNWAVREGPLCEEPVQHCKTKISELHLSSEMMKRNGGQLIPTMRKATHASILLGSPRLLEPVYDVEILCSQDSLPSVYNVLSRRRGQLVSEHPKPGTPLFKVIAKLPVLDSFGFEVDLRWHTIGQASIRNLFGGWEFIPGDPLDTDIKVKTLEPAQPLGLAKDVMIKTRRRKGLNEAVSLKKYFDHDLVLETIKEKDIFKGIL